MALKKLNPRQKAVADKIVNSGLLDDKELKVFYTFITKRAPEKKATTLDMELAELMWKHISANNSVIKKPNLLRWANVLYRIRVDDKLGADVLRTLINMVYSDKFWTKVVVDPNSLRRHANRLVIQFNIQQVSVTTNNTLFDTAPLPNKINYDTYEEHYVH